MDIASPRNVQTVMHPLRARLLQVVSSERIGPRMQRISLGGADLSGGFPAPEFAPADHVKLVIPDAVTGEIPLPVIEDDRLTRGAGPRPVLRDYTVREVDDSRLVVDFVLHDHGPAGRWAINASVGDPIGVLGPRGSHIYPRDYARYVLIADETALPAVGRWLDEPGLTAAVDVFALVQSRDEYPLPERSDARVHWIEEPVGPARAAAITAAAAGISATDDVFVWAAGEADTLKPLRRALRDRGFPRDQFDIDGYWRSGVAGLDHHLLDED
ncbi:siderophore-interacting protein [Microbacterium allomyrinae]|uniref:Siderophore-interacting protein n=1 Tax=Microbacterium allomyrinae TaxID=2830666 RepID=A0A9X1S223_9MICO|nr:siderophore-interacting protein [Microbacterium allomyrinae]MCC2031529.1 siderophore-interacting protein [Microbacterium allomyrinae]